MTKKIAALVFIFVCTSIAWIILGSTIFARTYNTDISSSSMSRVASSWGSQQTQSPPQARWTSSATRDEVTNEDGKSTKRSVTTNIDHPLPLQSSNVDVAFDLEHRQKGLLWFSTYKVFFAGAYTFANDTAVEQMVTFRLPFPSERAIYDDMVFTLDGKPVIFTNDANAARVTAPVAAGKTVAVKVGYRSQGLGSWRYSFGQEVSQVHNFTLRMKTNFKDIDFPENTVSPTDKKETADGWDLTWSYTNLLSGFDIGMTMPDKLQPGPLAGQISFFAPVSLFFFFFLMFIITTLRNIDLHPMNYFFLATAFFAFHLLMAYTVDHISIHLAFLLSSVVSIFLVVTYLRLVVGLRFAAVEAGLSQFLYLVLFSYAFFFKGFTGLAVTVGSILTLFVVMQMTGRVNWAERFAKKP